MLDILTDEQHRERKNLAAIFVRYWPDSVLGFSILSVLHFEIKFSCFFCQANRVVTNPNFILFLFEN